MGTKRSILTDEKGFPLAVVLSGANTHDVKLLANTLDGVIISHLEPSGETPQNLCLDAGYTGHHDELKTRGYIAHIRPRGGEKKGLKRNPDFHTRRWVVEVTYSYLNRFWKLLVCFEKKPRTILLLSTLLSP